MEVICKHFNHREELKVQRQLFADCFPENLGTKVIEDEHYFWKFQSYPSEKKSYEYVAHIQDDMVGYYAAIPYRYTIAGKEYCIGMVCDVMTSSKYRGKGIFTKLGRYSLDAMKEERVAFTMGYPIRKEVMPGHLKVGWKIAFKQPLYMRFLSSSSLLKAKGKGYLSYLANPALSLYNLIIKQRNSKGIEIKTCNHIEEVAGYEPFVKEWMASVPNALHKSLDFARWRYGAPDKEYCFIAAYKEGKLVGFASIRGVVKEHVPSFGILDFMVLPQHTCCLPNIHNKIYALAKEQKKEAIMTMMSRTSASAYKMYANGFLKSPFIFHVIINKLDDSIADEVLFNERNWHLMFIDSDDL